MMTFSYSWALLFVAVILILLSAFGIQFGPADLFKVGVAFGFAATLAPFRSV